MPIMEVTLEQVYEGESTINRWNYIGTGTPAAVTFSFALSHALGAIPSVGVYPTDGLLWALANCQMDSVEFIELTVRSVYEDPDFYTVPFQAEPLSGQVAGQNGAPVFVAYKFRTNRVLQSIRRGFKRFVGVADEYTFADGSIETTFLEGPLATLASRMSENLEYDDDTNILTFIPCIVSKERYVPNPANPDRYAYRYYETEIEQLDHVATSVVWSAENVVGHQVSRRYRGA